MASYNRIASVVIGPPGEEGLRIEGLHIAFNVKKTSTRSANTAEVDIYNLSPETRGRFQETEAVLQLFAGYAEDSGEVLLFSGDVSRIIHRRKPPDIISTFECGDGEKILRDSRVNLSYTVGSSPMQIINDIVGSMGIPFPGLPQEVEDQPYANAFAFIGPAGDALDAVTDRLGLQWSIQSGEMKITLQEGTDGSEAVLLKPDTGLILSPERLTDIGTGIPGASNRPGWKVVSLLDPRLEPGSPIQIESRETSGIYRIEEVLHKGDTHGPTWVSETEVSEIAE